MTTIADINEVYAEVSQRTGWKVEWRPSPKDNAYRLHINGRDMTGSGDGLDRSGRQLFTDPDDAEWFVRELVKMIECPAEGSASRSF